MARIFDVTLELPLHVFGADGSLLLDTTIKIPLAIKIPDQKPPVVKVFNPPPKIVIQKKKTIKHVERGEKGEITRIVEEEE